MNPPNAPQRIVLVTAAVAVLALAFYPPFFPGHIRSGRFDIELAAVTLATIGLLLALRGLPKLSLNWRLPNISLASAGWKRLWIVLSLIYLSVVIGLAWHLYPTYPSEDASAAALEAAASADARPSLERIFGPSRSTGHNAPASAGSQTPMTIYNATLRKYYASEQRGFAIKVALWWVCPVVAIYLLGMAWGWVCRGFRPVREEE